MRLLLQSLLVGTGVLLATATPATASPVYDVQATWGNTNLRPGGKGVFEIRVRNLSEETGSEELTIVDRLPAGVKVTAIRWRNPASAEDCTGTGGETVACVVSAADLPKVAPGRGRRARGGYRMGANPSGYLPRIEVEVRVPSAPPANPGANSALVLGGSGTLPSGEPCARNEAELATLPACARDKDEVPFSATPSAFGILPGSFLADFFDREYPFGKPSRIAGDHPFELRFDFGMTARTRTFSEGTKTKVVSNAPVKTVEATLPRGLIGNPEALPKCDPVKFIEAGSTAASTACPANTQVGYVNISLEAEVPFINSDDALARVPLYSLVPPRGQVADFAFSGLGMVQAHLYPVLDPAQGYAIRTLVPDISASTPPRGSEAVLWGVPADPAHDKHRYYPEAQPSGEFFPGGAEILLATGAPFEGPIRPFFTNPMDCGTDNGGARIRIDSYAEPGNFTPSEEYGDPDNVDGCDDPRFSLEPKIALQPSDRSAGAPTGLDVHLEVRQRDEPVAGAEELYAENGFPAGISTPPLKKAVVTFPEGMTLNPSAAQGLAGCSPAQIGLGTNDPVTCPASSQYGTLTIRTPLLPTDAPAEGYIYIARQNDNPFHNFLSLYLVIEEPDRGILVKIPGRVDLDPATGRITTSFDDLPQWPVSDMQMKLKGGVRAGLVNPATCGTKTIRAEFFSWHEPGKAIERTSSYEVTQKPDGSPCVNSLAERPFKPQLAAGTVNNRAGSHSPFSLELTRTDDDQELSQLGVTLPPGLAAKFAGVGICPESGIAQALGRETVAGDGALEQAGPSCPATSEIGTTEVGTGVGVPLSWVPGKVYLSGPYKGAPMSLVVISPAVIGPYDLGVITVRTALNVNPVTAQGEALSDPFPQIFQGIPVRIRDIRLNLNREGFTLNPTSCAEKQIQAHITGTGGNLASTADDTAADLSNRFQAADCASLAFKPSLSFRLFGGTHRGAHPKLKAVVRARPGDANIAGAQVTLPHSEFLDQAHIKTVCTRVQFAAKQCPAGSIYGHAVAKTPLFDQPLEGPVYLRSSSHKLPDLVAVLRGPDSQPVEVDLDGRIDSVHGGIRNSFEVVPDAPVTSFTLTMQGGRKGLLVNSTNLCERAYRAIARFGAQNGRRRTLRPLMRVRCGKRR